MLLFFDLKTKYGGVILKSPIVETPTIIYIPHKIHYNPTFKVWATSNRFEWDNENKLLSWWPDKSQTSNQIIITPATVHDLDSSILPDMAKDLISKTTFSTELPV